MMRYSQLGVRFALCAALIGCALAVAPLRAQEAREAIDEANRALRAAEEKAAREKEVAAAKAADAERAARDAAIEAEVEKAAAIKREGKVVEPPIRVKVAPAILVPAPPAPDAPKVDTPKPNPPAEKFDPAAAYEATLRESKIDPTLEGIRGYLMSLHPGPETKTQLANLVDQLGSDSYVKREEAMSKLKQRSAIAMDALKQAIGHTDPEVRWRAKKLLENANSDADATFFAVFKVIEARQHKGLVQPVLLTLPLCQKSHVRAVARKALAVTATSAEADLLRAELRNADPQNRIAAIGALSQLSTGGAATDALALASDSEDQVRLTAARVLGQAGRRETLPLLISLLDSKDIEVRGEAGRMLKTITGNDYGFVAYDGDEARAAARDKWKTWHAAEGATAKLNTLVKEGATEVGRILLCSYNTNKIYEFDVGTNDPKPRWEVQLGIQPWGVQGLPSGNRLVAFYGGRKVVEFGPDKDASKPIWESEALPGGPMSVQRLESGNTLVACTESDLVLELNLAGKIDKKWSTPGRPVDARRLDNGNTLVTLQNGQKVIEIDSKGETKWQTKKQLLTPFSAQRLDNGNTLICLLSAGSVVELDASGEKEVWSLPSLTNPYHAQRLSNGNTLVADQNGVYEYTPEKKQVWKLQIQHVSRLHRF